MVDIAIDPVFKNSLDFKNKVQNLNIPKNHIKASLDVVSPFPSCTIRISFSEYKKKVERYKIAHQSHERFLHGLDILTNTLHFQFNYEFYQQKDGLPIGPSLSPILADLLL